MLQTDRQTSAIQRIVSESDTKNLNVFLILFQMVVKYKSTLLLL